MEEDDDPPVDDDFELDLEAVDVVFFAFAVVSLDFNAVASDSILVATAPVTRGRCEILFSSLTLSSSFLVLERGLISPQDKSRASEQDIETGPRKK